MFSATKTSWNKVHIDQPLSEKLRVTMSMAMSPGSVPEHPIDFRAPPPSPVASGRRSSVTNDNVLSEFLETSLRVPDLVLPDKIFPRQKIAGTPPSVDFRSLSSLESDSIAVLLDSVKRIGCFQLLNHGIRSRFTRMVLLLAAGMFGLSQEKKAMLLRSLEKPYGFEEVHSEEESDLSEEFVWCTDERLKLDMEAIWPVGYQNFSSEMEMLLSDLDKVASKILQLLKESNPSKQCNSGDSGYLQEPKDATTSICYIHKHRRNVPADQWASFLGYDAMRMLIRGTDHPHALALHVCDGSSEFHVYSKKGWMSFCPVEDAIIVTVGDQTRVLSEGQYKHVLGKPIFKGGEDEECISMAVLYAPPSNNSTIRRTSPAFSKINKEKTVSIGQQALFLVILTLVYQFMIFFYK